VHYVTPCVLWIIETGGEVGGDVVDEYAFVDAQDDCKEAVASMKRYLGLADPQELAIARNVLNSKQQW